MQTQLGHDVWQSVRDYEPLPSLVVHFDASTPSPIARAIDKTIPNTASTVRPRSSADLRFHQVGFL